MPNIIIILIGSCKLIVTDISTIYKIIPIVNNSSF